MKMNHLDTWSKKEAFRYLDKNEPFRYLEQEGSIQVSG